MAFGFTTAKKTVDPDQAAFIKSRELLDQFTRPDEELFPPYRRGFPAIHPDALLEANQDLVRRIKDNLRLTAHDYAHMVLPLLRRVAAYYQLLPASEAHHHNRAGGLFRHSLEVAFLSGQAAEGAVFKRAATNKERIAARPRWQMATFCAGLLHDCGKPETDYFVYDATGEKRWNPYKESLYDWSVRENVDRYFISWTPNRHQRHMTAVTMMASIFVPQEFLAYLDTADGDVRRMYHQALSGMPCGITSITSKMDSISTINDRKSLGTTGINLHWDVPLQAQVFAALTSIAERDNMLNTLRGPFWHLTADPGRLYVNWAIAYPLIHAELAKRGETVCPTTEALVKLLVDTRTFEPCIRTIVENGEQAELAETYWKVSPESVDIMIQCVRIPEVSMIYRGDAPATVGGRIEGISPPPAASPEPTPSDNVEARDTAAPDQRATEESDASDQPVSAAESANMAPPLGESRSPAASIPGAPRLNGMKITSWNDVPEMENDVQPAGDQSGSQGESGDKTQSCVAGQPQTPPQAAKSSDKPSKPKKNVTSEPENAPQSDTQVALTSTQVAAPIQPGESVALEAFTGNPEADQMIEKLIARHIKLGDKLEVFKDGFVGFQMAVAHEVGNQALVLKTLRDKGALAKNPTNMSWLVNVRNDRYYIFKLEVGEAILKRLEAADVSPITLPNRIGVNFK